LNEFLAETPPRPNLNLSLEKDISTIYIPFHPSLRRDGKILNFNYGNCSRLKAILRDHD